MPATPAKHPQARKVLNLAFKLSLTVVAFWLALRDVDWQQFSNTILQQNPVGLILASMFIFLQVVLGALRWKVIIASLSAQGHKVISAFDSFRLYYIGVFFSCCLPGTIGGDVVRVWVTRSEHIPLSLSVNSIIIDRLMALAGLVTMLVLLSPFLADILHFHLGMMAVLLILAAFASVWFLKHVDRVLAPLRHYKAVHWFLHFMDCVRILLKKPALFWNSLVFGILVHLCFCAAIYALGQSMNVDLSLFTCILLIPFVILLITLPISIGGWGVREMTMVSLLGLVGVDNEQALAMSVQMGLLTILVSLPGSLFWLTLKNRKEIQKDDIPLEAPKP